MDPHDNWDYDDTLDEDHSENVIPEADSVDLRGTPKSGDLLPHNQIQQITKTTRRSIGVNGNVMGDPSKTPSLKQDDL